MNETVYYSMEKLQGIFMLNVKMGIERCGSQSVYFSYLDTFLEKTPEILERIHVPDLEKHEKVILAELPKMQVLLNRIYSDKLFMEVGQIIMLLKKSKFPRAKEKLDDFTTEIQTLFRDVSEAKKEGNAEKIRSEMPKKEEAALPPNTFQHLLDLLSEFLTLEAAEEVSRLQAFTYGDEIDGYLAELSRALENFDSLAASEYLTKLITKTEGKEQQNALKKILAVDDNIGVLNTLKAMLKDRYEVFCIPKPKVAFAFLEKNRPDLIILDIEMPEVDGYTMLTQIRKMEAYAKTPVLMLTSNATKEYIVKACTLGANDYIKKPTDLATLLEKISKYIHEE